MKKGFLKCIAVIMVVIMTAIYIPMTDVSDLFSVEAAAATKTGSLGNNVSWKYDTSTKTITVSGSGNMKNFANGDDGQNWDSLVVGSLQYPNRHAEKIVINSGVTNIGNNAFRGLTAVKSVSIPASVTSIGTSAFEGCSALTTVNIPSSVKTIGAYAFKGTKFANVTIPASVTSIGDNAFANVSGLKFTCFYGDAAYNYAVKHSSNYVLKCEPVLKTTLDAANKQVKVAFEIKNTAGLNAANFTLTYNSAVKPVSTDYKVTEANGANIAVVFNETGKVSIALAATENVSVSSFAVVELMFDIVGQADTAEFSLSASAVLFDNIRINAKPVTGSVGLHVYTEKVEKEADCKNPGTKVTECSVCGKKTETPIPVDSSKHGETEVRNQKTATCKDAGYTGDTVCKLCGVVVIKGSDIPATGKHDYNAVVTDATCTSSGFTTYTCKVCADSYKGDFTAELGHDFDANGECTRCDEVTVISVTFTDNTGITVDDESKTIIIRKTLKAEELRANIASGNWAVTDAEGTALADGTAVAAGSLIKAESADITYTVIIMGDVNRDGRITASDARSVLRVASRLDKSDDMFNLIADCDGKTKITAADARIVLRVASKLQTF
ncbi:MAG: leucine-rich repeat protein [Clostridia bacterium]|nr:leucine-rich repeat protein [Clostridia bacterium]